MPVVSLDELLGRGGRKIGTPQLRLPDSVVTHDSIDTLEFKSYAIDSPRFKRMAIEQAPVVEPDVEEPAPIDMTTATMDEVKEYQAKLRAYKAAKDEAPPYRNWEKLTRDVFYSYHTHDTPEVVDDTVDPGVELHKRIMPKLMLQDDHQHARNHTRDNPTMAAIATMAAVNALREALNEELAEQAQEAQQYENHVQQVRDIMDQLGDLRADAKDLIDQGQPVPQSMVDQIKQLVQDKRAAQAAAAQAAQQQSPISAQGLAAIEAAAQAAQEASKAAAGLPSFGSGLGQGEPVYESPEQALSIAQQWAENPNLRAMAELFGRLDKDIRFKRSKRVVGGQDEIVDIEFGDNLNRVLSDEFLLLSDEDTEFDFLARFCDAELLQFTTVGEEHAGRGPIVMVVDGSGSMSGERNIWARAVAMCLLHIARLEKRDFAMVEFSGGRSVEQWVFPAKQALDAEQILTMCSHFFGGGTTPIVGVTAAVKIMDDAPEFKKADLVMVGDGESGFGPEDARLRDYLIEKGVRIFGMGIGGSFSYLAQYCEYVVNVMDFDLTDPSAATAELATHVT
jgi:uncharacterized protein with von Willebrand factor type A (vWA) domain